MRKNDLYLLYFFIFIILVSGLLYFQPFATVGVTTLSCDKANYNTKDIRYANGSLFCSMALTGNAKQVSFNFDKTTIRSLFGLNVENEGIFSGSLNGSQCSYKFDVTNSYPVYEYFITGRVIRDKKKGCVCEQGPDVKEMAKEGWVYLGVTPLVGPSSSTCSKKEGCKYVFRRQMGTIYYLDPSIFNDFSANLSMKIGNKTASVIISQTNPTARTDLFTVEYIGGLQGQQSCPAQPSITAFVSRNGSIGYYGKFQADVLISYQAQLVDIHTIINRTNAEKTIKNDYFSSKGSTGQYCPIITTPNQSLTTASISCNPLVTTNIPLFNLYVNAKEFSIIIPSGKPKIINVSFDQAKAATETKGYVTVKNLGETDAFDGSITGKKPLCIFASRTVINAGETKDIPISCEGTGIIGDYIVEVHSVNNPNNKDSTTIRLNFLPICEKEKPDSYKTTVFTEFGCQFICSNQYSNDVYETNCGVISNYNRCIRSNEVQCSTSYKTNYQGYHCIGEGKYIHINAYLDLVFRKKIQPYIPEAKPHQIWLASPYCKYVAEYGYKIVNGTAIPIKGDYEFYHNVSPKEGTYSDIQMDTEKIEPKETQTETPTSSWIYVGIALLISLMIYLIVVRKRR